MSTAPQQLPPAPAPQPQEPEADVRLTFMEHLRELRKRIIHSLYGLTIGMAAIGFFVEPIFHWLMKPVRAALPPGQQVLHYTSSIEPLMVYLKVAAYGGIFVAVPWVLYQLWLFVAPGLYRKEKKLVFPFLFSGTLLFYIGAAFCYFLIMPPAFPAMLAIASDQTLSPMLTMSSTLSLVLGMLLGFGVVFEVPVIIAFLAMIGVVQASTLAKYRRHAIVLNTIIAAVITPTGDPLNLALMAVPMCIFYEIGIILARILGKKPETSTAAIAKT
ncbi:MAG TPA: twin-arginine translocase subunit TatC [Anaeromyxobacter sp.]|nr:twin-arginine translocase subunit TatC [Anaeromyxobacter sp.]